MHKKTAADATPCAAKGASWHGNSNWEGGKYAARIRVGDDMGTPLLKAQHYHDQARHIRELAAKEENENARRQLLQLAASYERLSEKFLEEAGGRGSR